jgi:hypothetical protein
MTRRARVITLLACATALLVGATAAFAQGVILMLREQNEEVELSETPRHERTVERDRRDRSLIVLKILEKAGENRRLAFPGPQGRAASAD